MNVFARASLLAIAMTTGASATGAAQQECDVDEGRPRELATTLLSLTNASSAPGPEQRARHLKAVIKNLSDNADRIDRSNAIGRQFMLGKAYVLWMQQPGVGFSATRGELGFNANPDARVDLIAATDSAFDAVERALPQCKIELENWRMQQPWVDLINGAIQQINAGNLDSAETLVNKSAVLAESSPYGPNLLASIAQERQDFAKAIELRRRTIELAQGDTTYDEMRRESILNLAALLGHMAEQAEGAQKGTLAREAAQRFQEFVNEAPDSPQAVQARAGYANMMMLAGDTSAVSSMYADQIANPANYSDLQLVDAGVVAARAEKAADAAKLFEAALKVNPLNRDALFNLAASHYALKQYDMMFPLVRKLRDIDPANPENVRLMALAYQGKAQEGTGAAKKSATDSLIKYISAVDSLPVRVSVDVFSRGEREVSLGGTLQNAGTTPKAFTVTVEFLDAAGSVIGTQQQELGTIAPSQAKQFNVQLAQPGVKAWRYRITN